MQTKSLRSLTLALCTLFASALGCGPGSDMLDPSVDFRFGDNSESDSGEPSLLGVGPYVCGTATGSELFFDEDGSCSQGYMLHCDSGEFVSESQFGVCCNPKVGPGCTAVSVAAECPLNTWSVCEAEPIEAGDGDGDGDGGGPGLQICQSNGDVYQDYSGDCGTGAIHGCSEGEFSTEPTASSVCCGVGAAADCETVALGTYCDVGQWHVCDIDISLVCTWAAESSIEHGDSCSNWQVPTCTVGTFLQVGSSKVCCQPDDDHNCGLRSIALDCPVTQSLHVCDTP
jgi:hypothetical protein